MPATAVLVGVLWAVGLGTRSLSAGPGRWLAEQVGAGSAPLATGRWWTPLTSLLWCEGLTGYLVATALVAALCGAAEHRLGGARMLALLVVGHAAGTIIALGGTRIVSLWSAELTGAVAVGPSGAAVGVGLALTRGCTPTWRRCLRVALLLPLVLPVWYSGQFTEVARLSTALCGMALGRLVVAGHPARTRWSPAEIRLLLALVAGGSTVGSLLYWPGPVLAIALPIAGTVVLANGLRHGRRLALSGVAAVSVALAVFGLFYDPVVAALPPVLVAVLVLRHRDAFARPAPARTDARLTAAGVVTLVAVTMPHVGPSRSLPATGVLLWLVAIAAAAATARRSAPSSGSVTAHRPGTGATDQPATHQPATPATRATRQPGPTSPAAAIPPAGPDTGATDAQRARALLLRWGGQSMAYMTTWRGNDYWFSPDGRVVVAYRRVGSVALTVGEPIGPPEAIPSSLLAFAEFCAAQGWTPCLYCLAAGRAGELAAAGWSTVRIAEDTRLALPSLAFTGRKWQDVRTALSKANRTGLTAEWCAYRHASAELSRQLRAISAEWLRDKRAPEMTFTLGGLDELADDAVRCLAAVDADGQVLAFTSWLPAYRDGDVIGWTLDLMRRRHSAGNGVMEFLIATAALRFKEEGAQVLSLSGAPLARSAGERPSGALECLLDAAARAIEPIYGFGSLHGFKAKFQPTREPLFLAVPDPLALPSVTVAAVRAYLPALTLRSALRLAGGIIRRRPASRPEAVAARAPQPVSR